MKLLRNILIPLALLLVLAGCESTTPPDLPADTTPAAVDTTPAVDTDAPAKALDIISEGVCNYVIVRGEDCTDAMTDAAISLRRYIGELTGITPAITTDYKKKGTEHDPSTLAILVGETNFPESAQVADGMGYGEYRIRACGNKLVVAGQLDKAITYAANALCDLLKQAWDGSTLSLPADLAHDKIVSAYYNNIPIFSEGYLDGIYDAGNNTELFIFDGVEEQEYTSYLTSLDDHGLEFYADSALNGNLFSTYTHSEIVLNLMYVPTWNELRITVARPSASALPPREQDNKYTATTSSSVTQLGCEFALAAGEDIAEKQIGMCYIFRLADGSFIIEDGGFYAQTDAKRLFDTLVELNGSNKNIVIAAWIFSHTHGDHIGTFRAFSTTYAKQVTVESFIYNAPSLEQYIQADYTNDSPANSLKEAMARYPSAKRYIAHPGQVYHIRNAKITMLFTYELLMPKAMSTFNSSSIVPRIEIEGQSFMMLGDLYSDGNRALSQLYGKQLKSDFIQVAHHGASGGVYETNQLIDPVVVLWPLGEYDYFGVGKWNRSRETYNEYFFKSTTVREIIVAGSSCRTLPLPYTFPEKLVLPTQN